jgi:hypothetical protein
VPASLRRRRRASAKVAARVRYEVERQPADHDVETAVRQRPCVAGTECCPCVDDLSTGVGQEFFWPGTYRAASSAESVWLDTL